MAYLYSDKLTAFHLLFGFFLTFSYILLSTIRSIPCARKRSRSEEKVVLLFISLRAREEAHAPRCRLI